MEKTGTTETEYLAAISRVVRFVGSALDEVVTPRQLAGVAGFSPHHFHRIFRATVGESVRTSSEGSASNAPRTDSRTVASRSPPSPLTADTAPRRRSPASSQAHYGVSPRDYRRAPTSHQIPSPSGVHYGPGGFTPLRAPLDPDMLEFDGLCAAHRQWPDRFEAHTERLTEFLAHFSSFVYPPPPQDTPMTEAQTDIDREIEALHKEVEAAKQRLTEARQRRPKEPVADYVLHDSDGNEVRLSELFGAKDDLIVIHNMGTGCSACTMWADGFSGLAPHLMDRAAFVVCSPDRPEVQKRFAAKRNWRFRMVSAHDSPFFRDMGFWSDTGPYPGPWPGVSTFRREADGTIVRVGKDFFDAGDNYCATWPLFDLLEGGVAGWDPKFSYDEEAS